MQIQHSQMIIKNYQRLAALWHITGTIWISRSATKICQTTTVIFWHRPEKKKKDTAAVSSYNSYMNSYTHKNFKSILLVFNWNHFEMRFLNLRINFYLLRTFFLMLVVFFCFFCVVFSSFTTFQPNFTSGLLQVIYRDLG